MPGSPHACVRACVHTCVRACVSRECVCIRICMRMFACAYSPLLFPSRLYALDSTHRRASERESADQCVALLSSWQRSAPRTTSERSARRSCVSACPECARAQMCAMHAYVRTHGRECSRTRTQDSLLRRAATRTRERPRAEDDRCPVNFAMYCEHVAHDDEST